MPITWNVSTKSPLTTPIQVLVVPVWGNKKVAARVPARVGQHLQKVMRERKWTPSWGSAAFFVHPVAARAPFVALIGIGAEGDSVTHIREAIRRGIGEVMADARRHGLQRIGVTFQGVTDAADLSLAAAEAMSLANYSFSEFSKRLMQKARQQALRSGHIFVDATESEQVKGALSDLRATINGVELARTLVNRPAGHLSPALLVEEAQRIVAHAGDTMKLTVLNRQEAEKAGFSAFLAVARGSIEEPYVIHLQYSPSIPATDRKKIILVGKGITFDSGGLSLKPAEYMEDMKIDMAGAAAVLGVFSALGKLKPDVEVQGIICACENMPSGNAYRPGDIVTAMNGKTIEVLNTDAEGRITLADALTYAVQQQPDAIIDLATLTGANMVGLGETVAGLWGTDEALLKNLQVAAEEAGERVAPMPMPEEYQSLIESRVADLRNIATSKFGGAITAAMFLREFTGNVPWAHFDMAGPAYYSRPYFSYLGLGASGWGVRLLLRYLMSQNKST